MIGKTIGQYRIVGQLGRGGMGTVYKAVDETLDREVAIKILNPELADTEAMRRFRVEATILARLNHPEIATIYELFRSETDLLMVMEFVRGETLEKIFDRVGALPPEQAAYLIDRILSALEHAHRAGVVHRDIKPANVMVTDHGCVKIMDFGTARVRGADHVTVDGYMIGTPAYMPPEQVLGQPVDGRADLYSVGVVLYRLLTGKLPFKAATAIAVILQQISDPPTPLHEHREDLPVWCDTILHRALAKSPADRFQTAEEFREALGRGAGLVTTELNRAFALPVAEVEVTAPEPPRELERFGVTPVPLGLLETQILAAPNLPGSPETPPPAAPVVAPEIAETVRTPTMILAGGLGKALKSPSILGSQVVPSRSTLATAAGGLAVLAIVALQLPASDPVSTSEEAPHAASVNPTAVDTQPAQIRADPASPPAEAGVSRAPDVAPGRAGRTLSGSERRVEQTQPRAGDRGGRKPASPQARAAQPIPRSEDRVASAPSRLEDRVAPVSPGAEDGFVPTATRGDDRVSQPARPEVRVLPSSPRAEIRVTQPPPRLEDRATPVVAPPFEFEARALVDDGQGWRSRKVQVLLAAGRIRVKATDDLETLHAVPYDRVMSISYSRGRDPLWSSPDGPSIVARPGGLDLGIFRGERYWVALRVSNSGSRFVVLRLASEEEARRAIDALEARTGRRAALVTPQKVVR